MHSKYNSMCGLLVASGILSNGILSLKQANKMRERGKHSLSFFRRFYIWYNERTRMSLDNLFLLLCEEGDPWLKKRINLKQN